MIDLMNILISVNSNYVDKAQTMLFSLRMHTNEDVTVFLLNHSLNESEVQQFEKYLTSKCKMSLAVIDMSETALDQLPLGNLHFSIEMYYRILAQFVLPDTVDRILWLDADIVLLNDPSEFYFQDFDEMKYVVCADSMNASKYVQECVSKLSLPGTHIYFNSGVMLMNIEKLRQSTNIEYIIEQCHRLSDRLTYPDQDILNYLYSKQVKYADWKKYNYQLTHIKRIPEHEESDIVVLHYSGAVKPWNYSGITNASKYYWRVRKKQGDRWCAMATYLKKIKSMTVLYFRELKDILF